MSWLFIIKKCKIFNLKIIEEFLDYDIGKSNKIIFILENP